MRAPLYSDRTSEILDRDSIDDPHPLFARLRKQSPLSRIGETGVHLVANWRLIEEALQREADFSANLTGVLVRDEEGQPACFKLPNTAAANVIATADEPTHSVHRALAQPRLAAYRIAPLEAQLRDWTLAALRPWLAKGGGDFAPIAEVIPARAVARVLGLPETDVDAFRVWAMIGGDMLAGDASIEKLIELAQETSRMVEYLGAHLDHAISDPRSEPDAPLLHALALGISSGAIDRQQAIGIAVVMFGAGGESTAALIGSAMRIVASDPELADRLRSDPQNIPRFIEEVVRLESPFKFHYRVVRRPCQLGGFDLEADDRLMLLWASANRDETLFEAPDAIRLDRRHSKRHLGFGRGAHFCIGAPLARLEARVVIEEMLCQTTHISLREGVSPVYANSIFVRRLERLEIDVRLCDRSGDPLLQ